MSDLSQITVVAVRVRGRPYTGELRLAKPVTGFTSKRAILLRDDVMGPSLKYGRAPLLR